MWLTKYKNSNTGEGYYGYAEQWVNLSSFKDGWHCSSKNGFPHDVVPKVVGGCGTGMTWLTKEHEENIYTVNCTKLPCTLTNKDGLNQILRTDGCAEVYCKNWKNCGIECDVIKW